MGDRFKVVVLDHSFTDLSIERAILEPLGAEISEYQCSDPDEAIPLVEDADAVLVTNYATMTENTIRHLKHCKVIVKHGIGPDIIDVDAAARYGIPVANLPDYCASEVSEHAISLLYASIRKLKEADTGIRSSLTHEVFRLRPVKALYASTLGIVGFGRIGKKSAEMLANAVGEILFFDPYVQEDQIIAGRNCKRVSFYEICELSDSIIIHAPYSGDNYHMFDRNAFACMKKTPVIVNVGRGELVDNTALVEAVRNGTVSYAALDVVEGMPPISAGDPLLNSEHLLLTPHCAWYSEESYRRIQEDAANEVKRVMRGEPLRSWYNRSLMEKYGTMMSIF